MCAVDIEEIEQERIIPACDTYCHKHCERTLKADTIESFRLAYHRLKQGRPKQQYLLDIIRLTQRKENNHSFHNVLGEMVCRKYFVQRVLKISRNTYKRALQLYNAGVYEIEKTGYNHKCKKMLDAVAYLQNFLRTLGESSPVDDKLIIPLGVTKRDIYRGYKRAMRQDCDNHFEEEDNYIENENTMNDLNNTKKTKNSPTVCESRFYQLWESHVRPIATFATTGKVVKCAICHAFKRKIRCCKDAVLREQYKQDYEDHLDMQR